jgi:hypothetical protein
MAPILPQSRVKEIPEAEIEGMKRKGRIDRTETFDEFLAKEGLLTETEEAALREIAAAQRAAIASLGPVRRLRYEFWDGLGYLLCELAFKTGCWGPFAYAYRAGNWAYGRAIDLADLEPQAPTQ